MLKCSASLQRTSEKLLHRESTSPAVLCLSYSLPFDPLPSLLVGMHSVLLPSQRAPPDGTAHQRIAKHGGNLTQPKSAGVRSAPPRRIQTHQCPESPVSQQCTTGPDNQPSKSAMNVVQLQNWTAASQTSKSKPVLQVGRGNPWPIKT